MKKQIVLCTFLQLTVACFAQDKFLPIFEGNTVEINTVSLKSKFRHFSAFQLESRKLSQLVHQNSLSSFRLDLGKDKIWDIDLEPSDIVTQDYQLKVLTPQGTQVLPSHPDFLFKGKVRGSSKDEEVRLTIKEGFIYGSIQSNGKEFFIEPLNRFTDKKDKDEFIVYEGKDVLNTETFSCGFKDEQSALKNAEQQNALKEQSPQEVICKKVKFISVADYSIFQKFGNDVYAVETALLSNLNMAEGAYATLNLGSNGSTDVGSDKLQLLMEEILVSSCTECDIISKTESAPDLGLELNNWLLKFCPNKGNTILQFWTTRSLFEIGGKALGGISFSTINCSGPPAREILKYHSDDPAFLRMLVAHETGHLLGCRHDDEVKANVKGFIMQSSIPNPTLTTRFSTLADFGGVNYSSQKTIHDFVNFRNCLPDCQSSFCEKAKNLRVTYFKSPDSIHLNWDENGAYRIRYRLLDSSNFANNNIYEVTGNTTTIKGLSPCRLYFVEAQRKCSDSSYSQTTSVVLNTSSLDVICNPVNDHGDKYDLDLNFNCKNCSSNQYIIKLDNKPYLIPNNSSSSQIIIKDLFADGARHRIDVAKDSGFKACFTTAFYDALYYRSNSNKILPADFNDCVFPVGWKDTLLAKAVVSQPDAKWYVSDKNSFSLSTLRGNFDSSCILYYNRYNSFGQLYSGAVSLTSPVINITPYENIKLHFDYNFLSYKTFSSHVTPTVSIDVYDGVQWINVFKRKSDTAYPNIPLPRRNVWDSIPHRVFIDLDSYRNKNFQLRLIADDGSLTSDSSGYLFAAFDNIQIDGYLVDATTNDFKIYPNPTRKEVFIQFAQPVSSNINYNIIDVSGRTIKYGVLTNYRIDLKTLTRGIYFLRLYQNNLQTGKTKKVIKQ